MAPGNGPENSASGAAAAASAGGAADGGAQAANNEAPELSQVQLALYAGWTMAVLYGPIVKPSRPNVLPTVNELEPEQRRELEFARLQDLVTKLMPDPQKFAALFTIPAGDSASDARQRQSELATQHFEILKALTDMPPEVQLAYELGRSLRDTANPPDGQKGIAAQLERSRIAKLQEWLVILAPEFPPLTAAVAAGSLGRWSELAQVTVAKPETTAGQNETAGGTTLAAAGTAQTAVSQNGTTPRQPQQSKQRRRVPGISKLPSEKTQGDSATAMAPYLLNQGDVWLMLLTGELETSGLLTPEGYVAAGEAALRRAGAMVRSVIRHYWLGLLCIAAAMVAVLILAASLLQGGGRVWTSIAAIVGGLGFSAQTIASASSRLASETVKPVFAAAEEDAMAWAITTMPQLSHLTVRGVRHLRRAGVAPTSSLGRF